MGWVRRQLCMKDGTGRRSDKYPSPCWKSKGAIGLEGRQPPHESAMLSVVLSCFPERACQSPAPLDSLMLSPSPQGPPSQWRLASAGLLRQCPLRWGAGRALAAASEFLLTFSSRGGRPDILWGCWLWRDAERVAQGSAISSFPLERKGVGSQRRCFPCPWEGDGDDCVHSPRDAMALRGSILFFLPTFPAPCCQSIPSALCIQCCSWWQPGLWRCTWLEKAQFSHWLVVAPVGMGFLWIESKWGWTEG